MPARSLSPVGAASAELKRSPRERLLAAANELFYAEGVHTVGIDRVIDRAGVAKASLYNTFGSKDELVKAYLEGRHAASAARISRHMERYDSPRDRLLAVFEASNRRMLPKKYADLPMEELQARMNAMRAQIGTRR